MGPFPDNITSHGIRSGIITRCDSIQEPFFEAEYDSLELNCMPIDYPRMLTGEYQWESASNATAIYPSLSVKPPKSFGFSKFEQWSRWVKRFERYHVISAFATGWMNALLYALGDESEDIFTSFTLDDGTDQNNWSQRKVRPLFYS